VIASAAVRNWGMRTIVAVYSGLGNWAVLCRCTTFRGGCFIELMNEVMDPEARWRL
jgi:hypothetical protein